MRTRQGAELAHALVYMRAHSSGTRVSASVCVSVSTCISGHMSVQTLVHTRKYLHTVTHTAARALHSAFSACLTRSVLDG